MKVFTLSCCLLVVFCCGLRAQISDFNHIDFRKADSIATLYPRHSLKNLRILTGKLTASLTTEEEKFRSIYKWICNNIEYDYALYLKNNQQKVKLRNKEDLRKWNERFSKLVFRNLLYSHRTVCSGYAYLLKELATYAGISCVMIDGYGRTSEANLRGSGSLNHSWNAVQLHNKWYLCDATWSAGSVDMEMMKYVKKYNASYFLPDPSLFVRNHYPLDSAWILLYNKPTLKQFLNGPLVYSGAFSYQINQLLPETFDVNAKRGRQISFQFTKNSDVCIDKVELYIKRTDKPTLATAKFYQNIGGFYCVDYVFNTKGTYTVHLLLNRDYMCTYTVRVQ